MKRSDERNTTSTSLTRRRVLRAGAAIALTGSGALRRAAAEPKVQWRNRQPGMAYRRLGRTGMMISEVISGGDPIKLDNYRHLELALERGLNYLDMAPAYNDGDTERAYGKLLAASPGRRDRVFLTTKISGFSEQADGMYREIFDALPAEKKERILKRARELRDERAV